MEIISQMTRKDSSVTFAISLNIITCESSAGADEVNLRDALSEVRRTTWLPKGSFLR